LTSDGNGGLQITLPAAAENVALVRHAVSGLAETLGMDQAGIADLKTVVTESCTNVVVHAYDGEPGPMEVEARPDDDCVLVIVRDHGVGIQPQAEVDRSSLRLGLSLIAAMSRSFAISGGLGRGTEIRMWLPLSSGSADAEAKPARDAEPDQSTTLTMSRPEMLRPVLARVVGALAARRDLTIDRLSDAVLLTDAISADAPSGFADGRVRIDLRDADDGIDLRVGPMQTGAAERLRQGLELRDVGSLEQLADELAVERNGDGEYMVVHFATPDLGR
jgi:hypothetical protein